MDHCAYVKLSKEQLLLIREYGALFKKLEYGMRAPQTPDEEHFMAVHRGDAAAITPQEIAWFQHQVNLEIIRDTPLLDGDSDIEKLIYDEIEKKIAGAKANDRRAYIDSTF